jgi:hypothetical protein
MLQFLLGDYIPGYGLPCLSKTVSCEIYQATWTLVSEPNAVMIYCFGRPHYTLLNTVYETVIALRIGKEEQLLVCLLENGREYIFGLGEYLPSRSKVELVGDYLLK